MFESMASKTGFLHESRRFLGSVQQASMRRPPRVKSYVVDTVSLLLSIQTVRLPFALLVSRLAARCTLGSDLVGAAIFAAAFSKLSEMSSLVTQSPGRNVWTVAS
jgi:hypothetical protein